VGYAVVIVSAALLPETSGIDLNQAGGGDDQEDPAAAQAPVAARPA